MVLYSAGIVLPVVTAVELKAGKATAKELAGLRKGTSKLVDEDGKKVIKEVDEEELKKLGYSEKINAGLMAQFDEALNYDPNKPEI